MAAEDCKPHKSLRTTIKVFLRTEEKKREALRLKDEKITPPQTPAEVVPTPVEIVEVVKAPSEEVQVAAVEVEANPAQDGEATEVPVANEVSEDVPQQSIEVIFNPKTYNPNLLILLRKSPLAKSLLVMATSIQKELKVMMARLKMIRMR